MMNFLADGRVKQRGGGLHFVDCRGEGEGEEGCLYLSVYSYQPHTGGGGRGGGVEGWGVMGQLQCSTEINPPT